jgi:putative hydrolase of the HAD superfamily
VPKYQPPTTIHQLPITNSPLPKVIFLDAVGTLFGVKGSVGEVYSSLARNWGVETIAADLNKAFFASFKASPPPVFPEIKLSNKDLQTAEFQWWSAIARNTFAQIKAVDCFSDFDNFFVELYEYFATDKPWYIYPDVLPALTNWRQKGVELGIISNFDTRLDRVLKSLNLQQFFSSITVSSVVGAAKPDCQIFLKALAKHNCQSDRAWHIGDSLTEDYQGAEKAGISAFWLNRL